MFQSAIHVKFILFEDLIFGLVALVGSCGISTIVGYLTPNLLYAYTFNIYIGGGYGISTIVGYLTPNLLYKYILNIYI